MTWNYRVIRTEDWSGIDYTLRECFYNEDSDTIPSAWGDESVDVLAVSAETRIGLLWVLAVMTEGVAKPVLEIRDGKMIEVEPMYLLSDDLKKAIEENKKFAEGMV